MTISQKHQKIGAAQRKFTYLRIDFRWGAVFWDAIKSVELAKSPIHGVVDFEQTFGIPHVLPKVCSKHHPLYIELLCLAIWEPTPTFCEVVKSGFWTKSKEEDVQTFTELGIVPVL